MKVLKKILTVVLILLLVFNFFAINVEVVFANEEKKLKEKLMKIKKSKF